jgi:hypothetical protein
MGIDMMLVTVSRTRPTCSLTFPQAELSVAASAPVTALCVRISREALQCKTFHLGYAASIALPWGNRPLLQRGEAICGLRHANAVWLI